MSGEVQKSVEVDQILGKKARHLRQHLRILRRGLMDYLSRENLSVLAQKKDIRVVLHVHEGVGRVAVATAGGPDQNPGVPDRLGKQEPHALEPAHQPLRLPTRHAYHHPCLPGYEF